MGKSNVLEFQGRDTVADPLTGLLRIHVAEKDLFRTLSLLRP